MRQFDQLIHIEAGVAESISTLFPVNREEGLTQDGLAPGIMSWNQGGLAYLLISSLIAGKSLNLSNP